MLRTYRSTVLVVAGCVLVAASPPQRTQENDLTNQALADSIENVAAAIQRGNEREDYNPECERGRDNRRSDLCAQWKAADAASESAAWAGWFWWLTVFGTAIGAATFGAAVAAAKFAKDAAGHTATGAQEARRAADAAEAGLAAANRVSEIQLQPYIRSEEERSSVDPATPSLIELELPFKNVGQTSALDTTYSSEIEFAELAEPIERGFIPEYVTGATHLGSRSTSFGTVARDADFIIFSQAKLNEAQAGLLHENKGVLRILAVITYRDVFDKQWIYRHNFYCNARALKRGFVNTEKCSTDPIVPGSPTKERHNENEAPAQGTE
jgi:hypothetical protein